MKLMRPKNNALNFFIMLESINSEPGGFSDIRFINRSGIFNHSELRLLWLTLTDLLSNAHEPTGVVVDLQNVVSEFTVSECFDAIKIGFLVNADFNSHRVAIVTHSPLLVAATVLLQDKWPFGTLKPFSSVEYAENWVKSPILSLIGNE